MDLAGHGLRIVHRRVVQLPAAERSDYLIVGEGRTKSEVAKFSAARRRAAGRLWRRGSKRIADVLRDLVLKTPPNVEMSGAWPACSASCSRRAGSAQPRRSDQRPRDLLALFAKSAGDWLDGWFESDPIKAAFGFDGIVGNYASPYTPGTAYVLLHHVFGEVNGKKGVWGHAIGGMGAITQAMARACAAPGVDIRTDAPVARGVVEKGRAVGVVTEAGDRFDARRSSPT